jgi:hypothetical protein
MKNFDEFKECVERNSTTNSQLSKHYFIRKSTKHLLFILSYPDDLEWDFGVEKQTQTSWLHISGGLTGSGQGHDFRLCYQSEVNDILKEGDYTHAMIISVGMVFDMTLQKDGNAYTAITQFYKFTKSSMFCKAHIIAKPGKRVYFHHQHIELNVDMWKTLGCPNIYGKWDYIKKSSRNFHDDYTPYWIDIKGFPRVNNFDSLIRKLKSFSYPHKEDRRETQNKNWTYLKNSEFDKVDLNDYYFSRFMTRIMHTYYAVNNERFKLKIEPTIKNFDTIISPTAGYFTEKLVHEMGFEGKVIFYDYDQKNLDLKRMIVDMNMSWEDTLKLRDWTPDHQITIGWNSDSVKEMYELAYGQDDLVQFQENMSDKCDVEYLFMDIINPDWDKLENILMDKRVFFNTSNIFSYHVSHATYTLEELYSSFYKLLNLLYKTEHFYFTGTRPSKDKIYFDKSIKLFQWNYNAGQYTKPRTVR